MPRPEKREQGFRRGFHDTELISGIFQQFRDEFQFHPAELRRNEPDNKSAVFTDGFHALFRDQL